MRAATGGSLAALFMIAPLVAIPVFAVVGIPQVAPAVNAATEDDDPVLPSSSAKKTVAPVPAKAGAEDLFAPLDSKFEGKTKGRSAQPDRVIALTEDEIAESADSEPRFPESTKSKNGNRRARSTREIDDALRSTDLVEWIPPAEALQGWSVVSEKGSRTRTQPAATDVISDDLPPITSRVAKVKSITPSVVENPPGTPAVESEPQAHAHRKTRAALPKKKRSPSSTSDEMNFASVMEPTTSRGAASAQPVEATRRSGNAVALPPAPAPRTSAPAGGKISLAEFTPGLVHPSNDTELLGNWRASPEEQPETGNAKLVKLEEPSAKKSSPSQPVALPDDDSFDWETATQRLKELGIRKHKLENLASEGRYLFSCSFTPGNNPKISRRFEAVEEKPLLAVQAVLRQIDEWQSQH